MLSCVVVLVLALLPPFVGPGLRHALMQGFDLTCHQLPERSFQIGGIPLALCHRCTGVVVGLLIGTTALSLFRKADGFLSAHLRTLLLLAVIPMVVDWGLEALSLWSNTPFSRFASGSVFGIIAGYAFARALSLAPALDSENRAPAAPAVNLTHPIHNAHA